MIGIQHIFLSLQKGPETAAAAGQEEPDFPRVRVAQGVLRGRRVTSDVTNKTFYSFQGIPYAQPPVGNLRFADPKAPKSWSGERNATSQAQRCAQFALTGGAFNGSEDCLYLDVYTPQLPAAPRPFHLNLSQLLHLDLSKLDVAHEMAKPKQQKALLPVMVFVPGGGFVSGSSNDEVYAPDFLVEEGIVLVVINYRLSCFGFLLLREAVPGNMGLRDQVAALQWVKKNIKAFGGDPRRVTIFGESAGAVSVHWHMLSPLSKGLFVGAIAQSGSVMSPWAMQHAPYETSRRLGAVLNCTQPDDEDVLRCLRGVDMVTLTAAAREKASTDRDRQRLVNLPFVPTDKEYPRLGRWRFATASTTHLVTTGKQHAVPFLTGFNNAEWLIALVSTGGALPNPITSTIALYYADSRWDQLVLPDAGIPDGSNNATQKAAAAALRAFYLGGKPLTLFNVQGFERMFTDMEFAVGIYLGVKYNAISNKAPVYLYEFSADDKLNYLKQSNNIKEPGAGHSDEIGYLFNVKSLPERSPGKTAGMIRSRMVRMWTNFAKTGNPTPDDDSLLGGIRWKPFKMEERNYLRINANLTTGVDLRKEQFAFWEEFFRNFTS